MKKYNIESKHYIKKRGDLIIEQEKETEQEAINELKELLKKKNCKWVKLKINREANNESR